MRALSARNAAVADFVTDVLTEMAPAGKPVQVGELLERSQSVLMSGPMRPEHRAAILSMLAQYFLTNDVPSMGNRRSTCR